MRDAHLVHDLIARAGWFGNDKFTIFDMNTKSDPARTAAAWQIGTTTILSTAPLEGSIRMILARAKIKSKFGVHSFVTFL